MKKTYILWCVFQIGGGRCQSLWAVFENRILQLKCDVIIQGVVLGMVICGNFESVEILFRTFWLLFLFFSASFIHCTSQGTNLYLLPQPFFWALLHFLVAWWFSLIHLERHSQGTGRCGVGNKAALSNFCVHMNLLKILLKCKFWPSRFGVTPEFWISQVMLLLLVQRPLRMEF